MASRRIFPARRRTLEGHRDAEQMVAPPRPPVDREVVDAYLSAGVVRPGDLVHVKVLEPRLERDPEEPARLPPEIEALARAVLAEHAGLGRLGPDFDMGSALPSVSGDAAVLGDWLEEAGRHDDAGAVRLAGPAHGSEPWRRWHRRRLALEALLGEEPRAIVDGHVVMRDPSWEVRPEREHVYDGMGMYAGQSRSPGGTAAGYIRGALEPGGLAAIEADRIGELVILAGRQSVTIWQPRFIHREQAVSRDRVLVHHLDFEGRYRQGYAP